jgi:DNA-binding MarR family transcriptional regulator
MAGMTGMTAVKGALRAYVAHFKKLHARNINLEAFAREHIGPTRSVLARTAELLVFLPDGNVEAFSQGELARVLGASRPYVCRTLATLTARGIIQVARCTVRVVQREALAEIAAGKEVTE